MNNYQKGIFGTIKKLQKFSPFSRSIIIIPFLVMRLLDIYMYIKILFFLIFLARIFQFLFLFSIGSYLWPFVCVNFSGHFCPFGNMRNYVS
jgi:hypothetical protein